MKRWSTSRFALLGVIFLAGAIIWAAHEQIGVNLPQNPPKANFIDLNGNKIALHDLRGKVVVLNFWSVSCAPCIQEMPQWARLYQQYRAQGLAFIAITTPDDAPNYVLDFTRRFQLPFPVALDPAGSHALAFGPIKAVPTTFIIDKHHQIVQRHIGMPDFTQVEVTLKQLLQDQ
jgi:peroxiredoxin